MKHTMVKLAISSFLMSGLLIAGKNVEPVTTPVAPVFNINPLYLGVGLLWSGTSVDCPCANDDRKKETTYGYIARIGYDFNQYIGVEGRFLKASMDKEFAETTHYGIYLKPQYHIGDKLNVYALVGYGNTEIDFDCVTMNDYDDAGLSVGVGFEYDMSKDKPVATSRAFDGQGDQEKGWGIWVDYQNFLNDEGDNNIKSNIVTAGVTYDF